MLTVTHAYAIVVLGRGDQDECGLLAVRLGDQLPETVEINEEHKTGRIRK